MAELVYVGLLNAQPATTTSTTYKAKFTLRRYQNYADSVKKNLKPLTTYSMNAPAFNKRDLTSCTINQ